MESTHILIVDDDPALLTALTSALELRMPGVVVDTCEAAMSAVEKIAQFDYDAVVTDIKMPGMDGLALLKEIRALKPDLPTLLITGHGQHDLAVQALRGGAFDFVQKPIERDYFIASLNRAVNTRKMTREIQRQQVALADHAHQLEQAVQLRTEQLRQANFRKDEFLALLSHELRNPLATVRSGLEILSTSGHHDSEILRMMQEQLLHLVRLVDDLLDTSRIVRGKIGLRKEPVELSALVNQAINTVQSLIERHRQKLVVHLPDQPIWLHADPIRLIQVIENLLHNAIKYTDDEGVIELHAGCHDGQALITVRDSGVGIEPNLLPHVFDMFTQSSRIMDRSQGGLGVGLALVRSIVHMHDGSVSAHSEGPELGSSFTVRLPVLPAASHANSTTPNVPSPPARRILVVDDNVGAARMLSMLLSKRGHHEVEVAFDGVSALTKLQEFNPEVVLLDIGMPAMDGSEVARAIRAMHQYRNVYLVAVTGYGQEEDRRRTFEAGFDKHLVKPVEISEVEEVLAECR